MSEPFRALLVTQSGANAGAAVTKVSRDDLPAGEILVRVRFSGLNYKDALAVTGRGRIVRRFPMVPGVDLAGEVVESSSPEFRAGDAVFATGQGRGEETWGGFAEFARLPAAHAQRLPRSWRFEDAMGFGTAGLTAMLSTFALDEHEVRPARGDVLVTGASGGVGGFATVILARGGFAVTALTGRKENETYLRSLGANAILERSAMTGAPKPLASEHWAGAVDTAGGVILANTLAAMRRDGCVAACGLAGGAEISMTVFPFILRGVSLVGIEANFCSTSRRRRAWLALEEGFPLETLRAMYRVEPFERVRELSVELLAGRVRGRVVLAIG